jgi:hypothetical protein
MVVGDARAGQQGVGRRDQPPQLVLVGGLDELDPEVPREPPACVGGAVVDDDRTLPSSVQRP